MVKEMSLPKRFKRGGLGMLSSICCLYREYSIDWGKDR